ncbi:MAG TPA: carbon-nitrogen hydrolase family protein [Ottowia sp.]|nr:carbon-nitrogen hydrolase family protein [Ottowia sp.]
MLLAAIQMVSTPRLADNLAAAERRIDEAVAAGARLVSLPEYFCQFGLRESDKFQIAEAPGGGPIQDCIAAKARQHAIWIAAGTLPLRLDNPAKVTNTLLLFGPDGTQRARYDKLHLFSYRDGARDIDEGRTMQAGAEVVSVATELGCIGLSICYDLRFPELYRAMPGVDLILAPSAFTETTGRAHWELLLRARAVENQCYVLAAAQGGTHENGRRTWGHSMLVDPWGEVVACLPRGEGVLLGELSAERLAQVRRELPALRHRRIAASTTVRGAGA